jgi:hypothetical protein
MLKPGGDLPPSGADRSFGELASQLVDDAKAYARAEVDLAKAIAADKGKSAAVAGVLFGAALLLAAGAVSALCVAIFVAIAYHLGPLLGGLVTFVLVMAAAAGLGWFGWTKLKDAL